MTQEEADAMAARLEETLRDYGVKGRSPAYPQGLLSPCMNWNLPLAQKPAVLWAWPMI